MNNNSGKLWASLPNSFSSEYRVNLPAPRNLSNCDMMAVDLCSDNRPDEEMQPVPSGNIKESVDGLSENHCYSRYHEEFEELEALGKGGCGHVMKVFNITDLQNYAVKRVELGPHEDEINERMKREAELFARLKHENIVRYFGAWIEKGIERHSEIVWSTDSQEETEEEESAKKLSQALDGVTNNDTEGGKRISYLYIQMELCERTLREEINKGLAKDASRIARYFYEILEGLNHIHLNQVIHRDLKPDNIFIDREDHIKIGDFGLATCSKRLDTNTNCSHSGNVGTSVYKAPEIKSHNGTALYDQRVDMYSLGVVLLEMCYSFETKMERAKILEGLKTHPINLPSELESWQTEVIRLLVNYEVKDRPTASELLLSRHLSNLCLNGADVPKVVRNVLANRTSKEYCHLIDSCLSQKVELKQGVHYDLPNPTTDLRNQFWVEEVVKRIENVFQKHGATCLSTPLLHPQSTFIEIPEEAVCLMDKNGMVMSLPYNAKVSFARWVVWQQLTRFTRYATLPKYKDRHNFSHPNRSFECVFDIVSPSRVNYSADAKILTVVWDVIKTIPFNNNVTFSIVLNHTNLVKAALMAAGVKEEKLQGALEIIGRKGVECIGTLQLENGPIDISKLQALLKITGKTLEDLKENLFMNVPEEFHHLVVEAITELMEIKLSAWRLGVKAPLFTLLKLVDNIHLFRGMLCSVVCCDSRANRRHIVADGGCYDGILATYRAALAKVVPEVKTQSATGITVYPDRLMKLLPRGAFEPQMVVLWASASKHMEAGEMVARSLRFNGIRCLTIYDVKLPVEEITQYENDWRVFCTVEVIDSGCIIKETDGSSHTFHQFSEAAVYIISRIPNTYRASPSNAIGPADLELNPSMFSTSSINTFSIPQF